MIYLQTLRLRYGMFWSGRYPPILRPLFFIFVVLLLSFLASISNMNLVSLAQAEQKIQEMNNYEQMFFDCMNNKLVFYYDNGTGKGYGKTAVICHTEEIPV